jgi:GT2 family glycosyltransferase
VKLNPSDSVRISAIIPTRGRVDSLCRALDSIRRQNFPEGVEMIVVDDMSDPPLPALPGDVKVIRFEEHVGACAARNAGARTARGDFLLFMDDDAELIALDDLSRAVDWFAHRPKLALIGFRQLTPDQQIHYMQPVHADEPVRTGLFFSYGCLVRRQAYEELRGMNEEFVYYYEEVEFSLRLHAGGYFIIYDPALMVIHHQDNRHRDLAYIHHQIARNACLSYLIHYPALMLPALFLRRLHLYGSLNGRRFAKPADVWRVIVELFRLRGYVWRNRKPLGWLVIRGFHDACGRADRIDPVLHERTMR